MSRSASGSTSMWFLAPPSACTRLPLAVPGLVDVLGDRRRADEADRGDVGVLEDPVDGHLVALHDVEAPGRQAGLGQQLGEEQRRRRILLARLEHERVAAGEGVGEHPHRHHRREVERRDAGDDAERLADRVDVDAGRGLLAVAALHQVRDAAGELDVLEPAGDLAERVGEHLAVLGGEQRGDLLAVGVDQLAQVEHHLGPPRQVRGPPRRERRLGGGDGGVDLGDRWRGRRCPTAPPWPGCTRPPDRPDVPATTRRRSSARCEFMLQPPCRSRRRRIPTPSTADSDHIRYCDRPRLTNWPWPSPGVLCRSR